MNTTKFDKKCICGPEFVAVRILENCEDLKIGNIYIPSTSRRNDRLAHAIIENVGSKSAEEYGLKVGDYVMIDRLSTFAHTSPVALLRYNNVILKTNEDRSEFFPLRNMLFVEPNDKEDITNVGGIFVANYQDRLNLGKVLKMNCDDSLKLPFKVGDTVLVTNGADQVDLGEVHLRIYKHDMIICTVED